MDESNQRVVEFLEKEIHTYSALSLFFSKKDIQKHVRSGSKGFPGTPAFYRDRMKEAKKLIHDLRRAK
ncbi:MAG: hypothetical protein WCE61_11850 [Candidatus Acidiferrum sp.]